MYETRIVVKCTELVYGDPNGRICWPESVQVQTGTKEVSVYSYKTGEPFQVQAELEVLLITAVRD